MNAEPQPSCGHAEIGFHIITRACGEGEQYYLRCGLCGRIGADAIPNRVFSRRPPRAQPPSGIVLVFESRGYTVEYAEKRWVLIIKGSRVGPFDFQKLLRYLKRRKLPYPLC